jgi:eukaryotic-like serine/threonine-protein kinase
MDREHWKAVNEIFHAALERPASERREFVRGASGRDARLESDVWRLLEADERAGGYLETPILASDSTLCEFSSPSPLQAGDTLNSRYRILRLVGEGGMGHVFEAFDDELKVRIGLKVIRTEIAGNPAAVEFFRREVRTARAITHPNVCRTYDLDRGYLKRAEEAPHEFYFLTMEFLEGETLSARLKRTGRLAPEEALVIARQIASALDAAHSLGIVHRDIKPSNVMLVDSPGALSSHPRAVITDFGLARYDSGQARTLATSVGLGNVVGTLVYMAPEQLQSGCPTTTAADIYTLGLVLYEMVTGQPGFPSLYLPSGTIERFASPHRSPQVPALELPATWELAIRRCLKTNPDERFQSAGQVIDALSGAPDRYKASGNSSLRFRGSILKRLPWRKIALRGIVVVIAALFLAAVRLYRSEADAKVEPGALVYLAPVRNDAGAKAFDNITELVQAGLNQSAQVALLDQERVGDILQQMKKDPNAAIDQPTGREIAMRAGAVRAIFASVSSFQGSYTLKVDIQEPDSTPERFRDHWSQNFDWRLPDSTILDGPIPVELLRAVRTAGDWIRLKVGESKNDIARLDVPPQDATSSSWEALGDYAQAGKLVSEGRRLDAVNALDRAVRIDPEFASAYAAQGDVLFSLHRETEGRASYSKALEAGLHDRLTRREEDRVHGMRAIDAGDYEIAVDVFHDLVINYPKDLEGWVYPTTALRMLNRNDEAVANLKEAIRLAPEASFAPYALGQELLIEGRTQEVAKWIDYLRHHNHPDNADELESAALFIAHDYAGARQALASIGSRGNPMRRSYSYRDIADLDAEVGNDAGAIEELDHGMEVDKERGDQEQYAAKMLGRAYLECRLGRYENCLEDEHAGYTLRPTLEHALAADAVLDLALSKCPVSYWGRIDQELSEILREEEPNDFGRRSEEVKLRTHGELQLAQGRQKDALRTMTTAAVKDAPAASREYFARALLAVAKITGDKGKARVLLLRAQAAYGAVALHPALIRCDPGDSPPGSYGDQLEAYLQVSRLLDDHSDTVRKAEEDLFALRPGRSTEATH